MCLGVRGGAEAGGGPSCLGRSNEESTSPMSQASVHPGRSLTLARRRPALSREGTDFDRHSSTALRHLSFLSFLAGWPVLAFVMALDPPLDFLDRRRRCHHLRRPCWTCPWRSTGSRRAAHHGRRVHRHCYGPIPSSGSRPNRGVGPEIVWLGRSPSGVIPTDFTVRAPMT